MNVIARNGIPGAGPGMAKASLAAEGDLRPMLSPRQKAAVIVRLMAAEGMALPLADLSEDSQTLLTGQIAQMRPVDRATLNEVIAEFCTEIESVGLTFPRGLDGAITLLDGQLSASATSRLRRMVGNSAAADPWQQIAALAPEALLPVLTDESAEVGAVVLSKLSVAKAADLLGRLPGEKARRLAYAVSLTGNIAPDTVQRIGAVLLQQLDTQPARAFDSGPVERVGAILNQSATAVRESVIAALEEEDQDFADQVKKAIFTFALIPQRIGPRDIPKVLRGLDQPVLITALASARTEAEKTAADYILANISQRMADSLREEIGQRGPVKDKEAEAAQSAVVAAIRDLAAAGEITFATEEEEDG